MLFGVLCTIRIMYYKDRDTGICLPNRKTEWQGKICVDMEVSKEILPVTGREGDLSGSSGHIRLDVSE